MNEPEIEVTTAPESYIGAAYNAGKIAEARRAYALEFCMTPEGLRDDWKSVIGEISEFLATGKIHEAKLRQIK